MHDTKFDVSVSDTLDGAVKKCVELETVEPDDPLYREVLVILATKGKQYELYSNVLWDVDGLKFSRDPDVEFPDNVQKLIKTFRKELDAAKKKELERLKERSWTLVYPLSVHAGVARWTDRGCVALRTGTGAN
ncbi:MAG: hypothetical protein F4X92_11410 [Gammaproteobacteria bacterium]|nr:hypothetical protein [Gammaproteobacteria bacterium]